ncbi:MAG: UDP-N-acetylenolpyruvoylglucosamine reductase, partial [Desulfobulbaceae bacterium]|nr:UDP-N-acetylenolpyruvoylglucosamine reductase [Desulfobulbaceae bacterium]
GDSAGRLIEAAGLKGLRRGNAMVSTVHANFIVNTGQATADEIIELMQEIREKVFHTSGIMLEPEVQLL